MDKWCKGHLMHLMGGFLFQLVIRQKTKTARHEFTFPALMCLSFLFKERRVKLKEERERLLLSMGFSVECSLAYFILAT